MSSSSTNVHGRPTRIEVTPLNGWDGTFTFHYDTATSSVDIFIEGELDLINFKNNVLADITNILKQRPKAKGEA